MQGQVDYHSNEMECLENRSRNNIRIDGIPEELNETWDDIECKAKMTLESKLNLPFEVEIERAHRTGKGKRRSSHLVSWKLKDPILKAARIAKLDGIFLNEVLAAETLQRRKDQLINLKRAKQAGKIA